MHTVSIPTSSVRNSELYNLVKNGILKPGGSAKAVFPSGKEVKLSYVVDNGVEKAREMSEMYRIPIKPVPEEYITKTAVGANGNIVESRHDIVEGGTKLKSITEQAPTGKITHMYSKDGSKNGHVWTDIPGNHITWGFVGNVVQPTNFYPFVYKKPFNNHGVDAFNAATDYVRGKVSLEAYAKQLEK